MPFVRSLLCVPVIALALFALLTPTAGAHSATPVEGVDDRTLRQIETLVLGAEHAAEHARQRAEARKRPRRQTRPRARGAQARPAREVGAWESGARPILARGNHAGIFGIHAALLPTGKVMWFSYPAAAAPSDPRGEGIAVLWDPATGRFEDVPPPTDPSTGRPLNIWCAGQSLLRDGRLLVTGGNLAYRNDAVPGSDYAGLKIVLTFDPWEWERSRDPDRAWRRHADMRHGRWYPSQLLMPDGRTVILQGRDETGVAKPHGGNENHDIEVFDPSRNHGDEMARLGEVPTEHMGGEYPHTFWMPSGRALIAGPERSNSWFLEGSGLSLSDTDDPALNRTWGTAVLMPLDAGSRTGEVMQIGGSPDGTSSTPTVERLDEAQASLPGNQWRAGQAMSVARSHHNTVLLPDGSMVTIGGGEGDRPGAGGKFAATDAQKQVELFDPATGAWRLGPAQRENRAYHSTALLLPDGSVVSAGDEANGGREENDTYEIYRPPYFYRGDRPRLDAAPTRANYGTRFTVSSPDSDVRSAVLVAPGTTTHAVDMNQRVVKLPADRTDGGYLVGAPANADVAVPGHYMLFLLDADGLPSSAKWIEIGRDPEPDPAAQPEASGGSSPAPAAPAPTPAPAPARPGTTPGAPGSTPAGAAPARRLRADPGSPLVRFTVGRLRRLSLARSGRLMLRLTVNEAARVTIGFRIGNKRLTTAGRSRMLRFRRRGAKTVTLRLDPATRARLRRSSTVRVEIRTTARDAAGNRRDQRIVRALR